MQDMTRGLHFLAPRPECEFPDFVPWPKRWDVHGRRLRVARPRLSDRRSTSDKTGQATRERIRRTLIWRYGSTCHLCRKPIDLTLKWPDPGCFTRDHLKPRSKGGSNAIGNQRPAHKLCNESRGNKHLREVERG